MLTLDPNYYEVYGQLGAFKESMKAMAYKANANAEVLTQVVSNRKLSFEDNNLYRIQEEIAKMKKKVAKVDLKVNEKTSVAKLDTQLAKLVIVENPPAVKEQAKVLGAEPYKFGVPHIGGLGYTRIPPTDDFKGAVKHLGKKPTQLDGIAYMLLQLGERRRKGLEHGFKQVSKLLRRQSVYVASSYSSLSSSNRRR